MRFSSRLCGYCLMALGCLTSVEAPGFSAIWAEEVPYRLPKSPSDEKFKPPRMGLQKDPTVFKAEGQFWVSAGGAGRYLATTSTDSPNSVGTMVYIEGLFSLRYPSVKGEGLRVAAGKTYFALYDPASGRLSLFDESHGIRRRTATFPLKGDFRSICVGSETDGPLLISTSEEARLVDLEKMQFMETPEIRSQPSGEKRAGGLPAGRYWAAGDGRVFSHLTSEAGTAKEIRTFVLRENHIDEYIRTDMTNHYAVPGPRGELIYTAGGILTKELKPANKTAHPRVDLKSDPTNAFLPAAHGQFYVRVQTPADTEKPIQLDAFRLGEKESVFTTTLKGIPGSRDWPNLGEMSFPETIHRIPEAKFLVIISAERDRILVTAFTPQLKEKQSP